MPTDHTTDTRERLERLIVNEPDIARALACVGDVLASHASTGLVDEARAVLRGCPAPAMAVAFGTPVKAACRALALIIAMTDALDKAGMDIEVMPAPEGEEGNFIVQDPTGKRVTATSGWDAFRILAAAGVRTAPEGFCRCGAPLNAAGKCTYGETVPTNG